MKTKIEISPSPEARQLFGQMVNAADYPRRGGDPLILSLERTVELASTRVSKGNNDELELQQLINSGWIKSHSDGGWQIC